MEAEQQPVEGFVETAPEAVAKVPPEPVDPPQSRFLFVDIAALRAKQLRRGALPRLDPATVSAGGRGESMHRPERIAMEEVRRGLVPFLMPEQEGTAPVERELA
ncbi:MAG TPA: DNA-directed RNA polymerase subunit omega [Vicinamibacterales bacterium]|nr:DNA-directed RNA polymerase subunit omega [Vicinamibacterales bacterium]